MVMLHLLHSACLRADVPLVVAHIDHQLRSDSALDHALVKDIARKLGRPFESAKINVRTGNSVQSQARQQRYAALVRIANARDIDTIVTAHHQDDLKRTTRYRLCSADLARLKSADL
jgi:tRNA(Ile)-lysidine synthase